MRGALFASFAGLSLAASATPAAASVTLGQLDPGATGVTCVATYDRLQPTVTSGNSYVVPEAGTITSWTTKANSTAGLNMTMKVFRKIEEPSTYQVVGHDGPRTLTPGGTNGNTFPANVSVKPGDVLGLTESGNDACVFPVTGQTYLFRMGSLADAASGPFATTTPGFRLNITAVVNPSNTVTVGKTALNKKKGTATLNLTLPNPGELTASGNGVKAASAGQAMISKSVGAGPAQLLIKAKGKKKKTLNETGKVKLKVAITYTPANGDPGTQSTKVKLKKL